MTELERDKLRLLETDGHILALGGPGSGKTYIALLKCRQDNYGGRITAPSARALFELRSSDDSSSSSTGRKAYLTIRKTGLELNTYHGFAWRILQSHANLSKRDSKNPVIPPPEAAARLATIDVGSRADEKRRLFEQEGILHFDLFAQVCRELLPAVGPCCESVRWIPSHNSRRVQDLTRMNGR